MTDKQWIEFLEQRFERMELELKVIREMLYTKLKVKEVINTRVTKQYEIMQIEAILETPEGVIIRVK